MGFPANERLYVSVGIPDRISDDGRDWFFGGSRLLPKSERRFGRGMLTVAPARNFGGKREDGEESDATTPGGLDVIDRKENDFGSM